MSKITDLRREIKIRQEERGITHDFSDLKLVTVSKKSLLEDNARLIGKKILSPIIMDSSISVHERLEKLKDLINNENISIEFVLLTEVNTDEENYKLKLLLDVVKRKNGKKYSIYSGEELKKYVPLEVIIKDFSGAELIFLTMMLLPLNDSNTGLWYLKTHKNLGSCCISDFTKELSKIFLLNKLHEYAEADIYRKEYIMLQAFLETSYIYTSLPLEKINKTLMFYNLPEVTSEKVMQPDSGCSNYKNLIVKVEDFKQGKFLFGLNSFYFPVKKNQEKKLSVFEHITTPYFSYFLRFLIEEKEEIKEEVKQSKNISDTYARSFETKKNIPLKIQHAMKNNKFLKWFGEVEYDELVDLAKMSQVENEFVKFAEFINFPISKDHSLRFRRLGKHKAAGLYFAGAKAVCIDIGKPNSTIHELMHMIDYITLPKGCLSSMYNFRPIISTYRKLTNLAVLKLDLEHPFRKTWEGTTKYNKDYYHSPKEIFARTGEIYIKRILGFDNSLVDGEDEILYPNNIELNVLIEKYFDNIFEQIKEKKPVLTVKTEKEKEFLIASKNSQQLSMF